MRTCGLVEVCSPRGPVYPGKLIARAVELYRDGVKPGYLRWDELQSTLEKEFAAELKEIAQDKPTPETVMAWVRKYPDAPERLRNLRVQQATSHSEAPGVYAYPSACQPGAVFAATTPGAINPSMNVLFAELLTVFAVAAICRFTVSLVTDR